MPATIHDVLASRIDRLPEEPRRALQTASVLGREFSLRLLAAVWDRPTEVRHQVAELERRQFVVERRGAEGASFTFAHALTQDVAYDSMLVVRRRRLHETAGIQLERMYAGRLSEMSDRLAFHYSCTDRSDRAVHYLELSAGKAVQTYAHAEAAAAFREALLHADRLPADERVRRRCGLALQLVGSLYFLGRFDESLQVLLEHAAGVEESGDPELSGRFHMWLGHTYSHLGDNMAAARTITLALADAHRAGDLETLGRSHCVLARRGSGSVAQRREPTTDDGRSPRCGRPTTGGGWPTPTARARGISASSVASTRLWWRSHPLMRSAESVRTDGS